ncbi:MAG: EVE domain-containing protein [Thermoproteota archaeon]|nr:EVE domain-containing protein [Thermoproteota archaeon]
MAHWLGVTSEENWPKCLTHGVWGASENRFRALQQMKIGDDLLVYLKPMKIVGIFQITKEYFHDSTRIWKDGLLPHRVGFQPKPSKVPLKGIDIRWFCKLIGCYDRV